MKYGVLGMAVLLALFVVAGYSSGVAQAGDEIRLRAHLIAATVDPPTPGPVIRRSHADFRQRAASRMRFSVEVHNVVEPGIGTVVVTRNANTPLPVTVLETHITIVDDPLRGLGFGNLNLDSLLGDSVPVMITGDTVSVLSASGQLVLKGTLTPK